MTEREFREKQALLVVDVQNDFCPGGSLAVPGGDEIIPELNRWIEEAQRCDAPVFASRDWHPMCHPSFRSEGGEWPPHCVQDTHGAEFHGSLQLPEDAVTISKGTRFDQDQYSAFDQTGFAAFLQQREIEHLLIGGLAQDVCVHATVLDALKAGFGVTLLAECTRAIDEDSGRKALEEMRDAGATIRAQAA